jgi:regulator of sigma E protease
MTLFVSALAFFFLITGLIIIHELGHFIAARRAGVTVEEFGFGLPPRAKKLFRWQGTDFTLNWIPFGGFVRLKGENGDDETKGGKGSFVRASIPARCGILVAGVAMNFLLALAIFFFGFSYGQWIPTYLSLESMQGAAERGEVYLKLGVLVDDVLTGGTASLAGVATGSILLSVDGISVHTPQDIVDAQKGKTSVLYSYVSAKGDSMPKSVKVRVDKGKTGVVLRSITLELSAPKRNIVDAARLSVREVGVVTGQTIIGIGTLFSSLASHGTVPEGVTGIVGIAQLTYTSVQKGFMVYLRLVALLSLSLAILNIFPFPALDGGRLFFTLSEVFVKPGTRRVEAMSNTVGFGVLLLVIIIVTLYDIVRLFT